MQAIASLERFNSMSENTQNEFTETSAGKPDAEAPAIVEINSREEQPAEVEKNHAEASPTGDEAVPQEEQPAEAGATPTPENTLPPEAQGEANGGPLGCCLGIMIGLLLSLSLVVFSRAYATSLVNALQGNYGLLGLLVRILMGVLAFACAIFFGYVGWKLGKRFYREYEPPVRKRRSRGKKLHQRA